MDNILPQVFLSLLPAAIVGFVAYISIASFMKNEERRRRFLTVRESQGKTLPTRMSAYERMTLFLERIKPANIVVRTKPGNLSKSDYEQLLVNTIEQEFEHNIAMQIYVSEECWNIIRAAKNTTIQQIRQVALKEKNSSAAELRSALLNDLMDKRSPSSTALSFVREEVSNLF
ncbi:hypothetical protein JCM19294_1071 [Nonlabens tegetincola]|uniref:Uncharacterized protein n=1 Tax=Nonlabens tegetincola TaxID=323273 RepID=A0A090Q3H8_9FLAO|nr:MULTISPECIES: hypothetical protein [Nonlabens]MEE2802559.1 hypothetical protein [Bacteroidota bacterium]ALM20247.1 hypothetical protein AAT17_02785 [Nonlabens sp. MIC269]ARN70697.1 hypothetical protein BST91_03070 [Nonlabens tegetincola]PQJ18358.1 hypothetical protein BST93_07630 [Nonlabens tegetincola]GAK96762.1 hypothetical protein JCM19294_1071 [Nonlabens tegetincola]